METNTASALCVAIIGAGLLIYLGLYFMTQTFQEIDCFIGQTER